MNPILSALSVAALATIAAVGVMAGFRRRDPVPVLPMGDPLEDRRLALERSLADLEDARAGGALGDAEFRRLRTETQTRLERVGRAIDARHHPKQVAVDSSSADGEAAAPVAEAPRAPMRVPGWAVGVLLAGVVSAVVLSSLTRESSTPPPATAPAVDASDPYAFFEQRVRAHPDDVAARLDLARRYLDGSRVTDALEQYTAVLRLDPTDAEAHAQIGLILLLNGRPEQALRSVEDALQVAPDYPEAIFYKGVILLRGLDRPDQAIQAFRDYLGAAPYGAERGTAQKLITEAEKRISQAGAGG